jgi:type II secretory pathway pseudopilin PulG
MSSLNPTRVARAFTLLELLVVVGLIAAFSLVLLTSLGSTRGAALQAAQGTLANLLVAARTQAAASGESSRLLIQFDAASGTAPTRFLRHLVLQVQVRGTWQSVTDAFLPEGTYLMPGNFSLPAGLLAATDAPWTRSDGSALRSTALRISNLSEESIEGGVVEQWLSIPFAAAGTTSASGDLVIAAGRPRAPGSYAAGGSPIELTHPEQVRGLTLSAYGVATLINSRTSF